MLIIINVLLLERKEYIIFLMSVDSSSLFLSFLTVKNTSILLLSVAFLSSTLFRYEVWRWFTYILLHGSIPHLILNLCLLLMVSYSRRKY